MATELVKQPPVLKRTPTPVKKLESDGWWVRGIDYAMLEQRLLLLKPRDLNAEIIRNLGETYTGDDRAAQALRECIEQGYGIVVQMVDALRLVRIMRAAAAKAPTLPEVVPDSIQSQAENPKGCGNG